MASYPESSSYLDNNRSVAKLDLPCASVVQVVATSANGQLFRHLGAELVAAAELSGAAVVHILVGTTPSGDLIRYLAHLFVHIPQPGQT